MAKKPPKPFEDYTTIGFPCPECRKYVAQTLTQLQARNNVTCTHCGERFSLGNHEVLISLMSIINALSKPRTK